MSAFSAVAVANAANAGAPVVANDYNGHLGNLSVTHVADFIDDLYKWAVTAAGNLDLNTTVELRLCQAVNAGIGAGNAIDDNAIADAIEGIGLCIGSYELLSALNASGVPINIRQGDMYSAAEVVALRANQHASVAEAAQGILRFVRDDEKARTEVMAEGHFLAQAVIANAIHRTRSDGHNWYTADTRVRGTVAYKACAVAGKRTRDMRVFMELHGHDLFHYLTNDSLFAIANALTGVTDAIPAAGFIYDNHDRVGTAIHTWIRIGDAACDRWPVGVLGKSSLILGLGYLQFTINSIASKIMIANAPDIVDSIKNAQSIMDDEKFDREALLTMRDKFGYVIAVGVGYASAFPDLAEKIETQPSVSNFVSNQLAGFMNGSALAKTVKSIDVSDEALIAAIGTLITAVEGSLQ